MNLSNISELIIISILYQKLIFKNLFFKNYYVYIRIYLYTYTYVTKDNIFYIDIDKNIGL